MSWILLVLFYGVVKGARDVIKKLALNKNTVMEVLFVYTFIAFLFCIPTAGEAFMPMPGKYFFLIFIKSLVIFFAWILSFKALDNIPISVYGVIDLSRIIFSTLFGLLVLKEGVTLNQTIGFVFIISGLLFLKIYPSLKAKKDGSFVKEEISTKYVVMVLISCILNATSGCLDKLYMRDLNSSQLQFWYMLYLTALYGLYFVIRRIKISSTIWKNGYIWAMSILFFLGDKALFIANENPSSKISIMTLLKQSACIVSIFAGKIIFKEKNIGYKLFCAGIIVLGIFISVLRTIDLPDLNDILNYAEDVLRFNLN